MPKELYRVLYGDQTMYDGPDSERAGIVFSYCVNQQKDGEPPVFLYTDEMHEVTKTTVYRVIAQDAAEAQRVAMYWDKWKDPCKSRGIEGSDTAWDSRKAR